jgi:hypothetical protein
MRETWPEGEEPICAECAEVLDRDGTLHVCPRCKKPCKLVEIREEFDHFTCPCGYDTDKKDEGYSEKR